MLQIIGYADRMSVRPGETIEFKVSCEAGATHYQARILPATEVGHVDLADPQAGQQRVARDIVGHGDGRRQRIVLPGLARLGRQRRDARHLHRPDIPDVDLLLRTSGEQRTSNFMLWQAAYAEYIFQDTLWPDYDRRDLWAACEEYASRNRRFGTA